MRRHSAWLGELRVPGVLGVVVLGACAAFYLTELAPLRQQLAVERAARRAPQGTPLDAVAARAAALERLYARFPDAAAIGQQLEQLHRLARAAGLELTQGEYRLEPRSEGLRPYRMVLPVRGSYGQIREFTAAILKDMPAVALDALQFERKRASEARLEAQLRFTLYLRPGGEMP